MEQYFQSRRRDQRHPISCIAGRLLPCGAGQTPSFRTPCGRKCHGSFDNGTGIRRFGALCRGWWENYAVGGRIKTSFLPCLQQEGGGLARNALVIETLA